MSEYSRPSSIMRPVRAMRMSMSMAAVPSRTVRAAYVRERSIILFAHPGSAMGCSGAMTPDAASGPRIRTRFPSSGGLRT